MHVLRTAGGVEVSRVFQPAYSSFLLVSAFGIEAELFAARKREEHRFYAERENKKEARVSGLEDPAIYLLPACRSQDVYYNTCISMRLKSMLMG